MPIYEYKCTKCNEEFECLVFRSDESVSCPECNDDCVERLMSACSFKSSGNYSSSAGSASCTGCASKNCSTCH
ncbi:MAG: zinc ribbon domain-containing protein [Desulfobacteraceae bacterium]